MRIRIFLFCVCLVMLSAGKLSAQLSAQFSADRTSGCAPIRVQFTDESSGSPGEWSWDLGNGTLSPLKNPSATYFSPGTYTIKLVVRKGTDSAVTVKTNFITVYASPQINFSGTPMSGCLPLNVQFTDASTAGSGNITSWKWDFGDGILGTGQNPLHTYNSQGKFQVTLTVTNSNGCITSDTKTNYITGFDSIKAKFGVVAPKTCSVPATFNFVDSSKGANIIFYEWDFGDGSKSNLKNPSHTYTTAGIYDVTLRLRNSNGCEDVLVKKGIANAGSFKADFNISSTVCLGKAVSFINASNPIALLESSQWTLGNGQTSNQLNPVTVYNATGNYQVKLVSNFGACSDSIVKNITVVPKPVIDFTATPLGACKAPLTVNFTNLTTGGTVVRWDFGNGDSSTLDNPTTTYTKEGMFNVRLIVKTPGGCLDTLVAWRYIQIVDPVIDEIEGLPWRGCFPLTNQFKVNVTSFDPVTAWEWDFGDGTSSTEATPTHSYVDTGTYNVSVIVTTAQGCKDTLQSTLHGGSKPTANFQGGPPLICPLEQVSFTDLSTGDINEWHWQFGDGGESRNKNPTYMYTDTGWMHVILTVYSNGCADTIDFNRYIYVKPPIARFVDSFFCGNQLKRYFNDKSIGATYWKWYIDGTDSIESQNLVYTFSDTGVHSIKLYVRNDECEHEATQTIYILNEKPSFVTKDSGGCKSTFVTFSAKGPNTHPEYIKQYDWFFGDNSSQVTTDSFQVTHEFTKKGFTQIRLIVTDVNGCKSTLDTLFEIKQYGPIANFGPNYTAVCAGSEVTFSDSTKPGVINPISSWKWQFGDGSPGVTFNAAPFKHVYTDAGFYDVRLDVTDAAGCKDSLIRRVAVGVYKPKASFYSPDTIVCVNGTVNFFNTSTGSKLKAAWDFGNSKTASTLNAQTKYPTAGQYDVKLIIADSINCKDTVSKPLYINVGDAVANFTMSDSFTTCPPLVVSFTNKSVYNASNFWNFGNGNTSSLPEPSHTYTTPGVFKVKLIVEGNGGCTDSITKTIAIQGPAGKFHYGPLGGCPPLTVTFVSNAINTRIITWDFSDGNSNVTTDSLTYHTYTIPGTYVPKVIFADTIGCKLPIQGPDTIFVVGAKAFIQKLPRYNYCDTATISFIDSTITTDIVTSYLWDFGDGTTSTARNPTHFYSNIGSYQVVFEVRTAKGCVSRDTLPQNIVIAPTPIVTTGPTNPICIPNQVQFTAAWINRDTSTLTYQWNFGNGVTSNNFTPPPVNFVTPGKFLVRFIASNRYGCADTSDINLQANDTPRISVGPAAFICRNATHQLKVTGAKTYQWKPTSSLSCLNCDNPIAKPLVTEVFTVTGIDSNNCQVTRALEIKVKQPAKVFASRGDTLCVGESIKLEASGTERYLWQPAAGLSSTTSATPTAAPSTTTRYMVIGYDSLNCFADTGYVPIVVYPIPKFNIIEEQITANTGTLVNINTTSSADITRWHWTPPYGLNCTTCPEPVLTVGKSYVYTARVFNDGGCTAIDKLTVTPICSGDNVYIPNTFSPNGDGQNDEFYPRGRGISLIKSMRIYNRWGEMLYEAKDIAINDRSKGWNGMYKGAKLTPDVYVYTVEVVCDNNVIFTLKGNVTLLR